MLVASIFNVLFCLGAAALAGRVSTPFRTLTLDLSALIGMTALAAAFIRSERTVSRVEGAFAIGLYVTFTATMVVRG